MSIKIVLPEPFTFTAGTLLVSSGTLLVSSIKYHDTGHLDFSDLGIDSISTVGSQRIADDEIIYSCDTG